MDTRKEERKKEKRKERKKKERKLERKWKEIRISWIAEWQDSSVCVFFSKNQQHRNVCKVIDQINFYLKTVVVALLDVHHKCVGWDNMKLYLPCISRNADLRQLKATHGQRSVCKWQLSNSILYEEQKR